MQRSDFKDWHLEEVEEVFGLVQIEKSKALDGLLNYEYTIDVYEEKYLLDLQALYLLGGDDWNEVELKNKFISPLIVFSGIDNKKFAYFLERELSATIQDYELFGKVDGMIASGFRSPKKPYFCLQEYKRQTDPNGDPRGQCLIAMLVAQTLNQDQQAVFDCYIIGKLWHFLVLQDKEYVLSSGFLCTNQEIFAIYKTFKSLQSYIEKSLENKIH